VAGTLWTWCRDGRRIRWRDYVSPLTAALSRRRCGVPCLLCLHPRRGISAVAARFLPSCIAVGNDGRRTVHSNACAAYRHRVPYQLLHSRRTALSRCCCVASSLTCILAAFLRVLAGGGRRLRAHSAAHFACAAAGGSCRTLPSSRRARCACLATFLSLRTGTPLPSCCLRVLLRSPLPFYFALKTNWARAGEPPAHYYAALGKTSGFVSCLHGGRRRLAFGHGTACRLRRQLPAIRPLFTYYKHRCAFYSHRCNFAAEKCCRATVAGAQRLPAVAAALALRVCAHEKQRSTAQHSYGGGITRITAPRCALAAWRAARSAAELPYRSAPYISCYHHSRYATSKPGCLYTNATGDVLCLLRTTS